MLIWEPHGITLKKKYISLLDGMGEFVEMEHFVRMEQPSLKSQGKNGWIGDFFFPFLISVHKTKVITNFVESQSVLSIPMEENSKPIVFSLRSCNPGCLVEEEEEEMFI